MSRDFYGTVELQVIDDLEEIEKQDDVSIAIFFDYSADPGLWVCSVQFGREAPDSPMAGGVAIGTGSKIREAIHAAAVQAGWAKASND